MNWKNKKVCVTGAGGFIGSHLAERLVESGAKVRALVHYNALGLRGWLDQSPARRDMEIIAGDICDRDSVKNAADGAEIVFFTSRRSSPSRIRTMRRPPMCPPTLRNVERPAGGARTRGRTHRAYLDQ